MKKLIAVLFVCAFGLAAADFWSKPSAEWSDKDLQKMMNNSPWARPESLTLSGPTPPSVGRSGGTVDDTAAPQPISAGGGGGGRGGRGGGGGAPAADTPVGGGVGITIVARWQSARPIKEARVRLKFGEKADSSDEAKQILAHEEPSYVLVLSGTLQPFLRGNPEALKKALMDGTSLSAKGRSPLKPAEIQIGGDRRTMEIDMAFPRTTPFTLDDKEVDFATKLGDVALKYKFRLKDMMFNGKLEL
jgi:hypothetical protein